MIHEELQNILTHENTDIMAYRCFKCNRLQTLPAYFTTGKPCWYCGDYLETLGYAKRHLRAEPRHTYTTKKRKKRDTIPPHYIILLIATIIFIVLTPLIFRIADFERGYNSTGSEILFPFIPYIIYKVFAAGKETAADLRKALHKNKKD